LLRGRWGYGIYAGVFSISTSDQPDLNLLVGLAGYVEKFRKFLHRDFWICIDIEHGPNAFF